MVIAIELSSGTAYMKIEGYFVPEVTVQFPPGRYISAEDVESVARHMRDERWVRNMLEAS